MRATFKEEKRNKSFFSRASAAGGEVSSSGRIHPSGLYSYLADVLF